jgi:tetratricopeptide (TPR) repeat protein
VRYARQAGERAQAVYANQQALDNYRRADAWLAKGLVALRPGPTSSDRLEHTWIADEIARWRAELTERQGQVHSLVGEYDAADAAFTHTWRVLADLGDWRGAARVLNQLSFLSFIRDDYDEAGRYAGLALAASLEEDGAADLQAVALTHLGLSAWARGCYDDAQPVLEEALALFDEVEPKVQIGLEPYGLSRCLNSLGLVHLGRGDPGLADHYFARSLALRQRAGDRRGEAWCRHNQGRAALARGDLAAAQEKLEAARAIFTEIDHPYGMETCTHFLAEVQAAAAARETGRVLSVRLPRADAPSGRPLREDEYITVTWTIEAPADQRVQGKVARRRHRLLRLLEEARTQGAAPIHSHLAKALGVSRRTIERDVAFLRTRKRITSRGSATRNISTEKMSE